MPVDVDVSIIIPLYNCAVFFPECIESLVNQSYENIEIIIVDDESNDGSYDVAKHYAERDSRIRILRQKHGGAGAARNAGMNVARGEYFLFLDADDTFESDIVELPLLRLRETGADICVFGAYSLNTQTNERSIKRKVCRTDRCPSDLFRPTENAAYIFTFTTAAAWSKMYRASFVKQQALRFQELPNSNDIAFTMTANAAAESIAILDKPLTSYRTHFSESTQATKTREPLAFYKALLELQSNLKQRDLMKAYEKSFRDLALENCMFNLSTLMKDENAAQQAFDLLKNGGLETLGIIGLPRKAFPTCPQSKWEMYENLLTSRSYHEFVLHLAKKRRRKHRNWLSILRKRS